MVDPRDGIRPIALALRHLWLGVDHHRRALAKALGLSATELAVLDHLHHAGQLTPREVGERLGITTGSTTAILDRIEKAEFLVRAPNPTDRRSLLLNLTPRGERAMQWVLQEQSDLLAKAMSSISEDDTAALTETLDSVAAQLDGPELRRIQVTPPAFLADKN